LYQRVSTEFCRIFHLDCGGGGVLQQKQQPEKKHWTSPMSLDAFSLMSHDVLRCPYPLQCSSCRFDRNQLVSQSKVIPVADNHRGSHEKEESQG